MTRVIFIPFIVVLSTVSAQSPNWSQKCPQTSPPYGGAMVYDSTRSHVVMFNGKDTWIWNGSNWAPSAAIGPSARTAMAMAYDAGHDQVVLFGGFDISSRTGGGKALNDTWVWDGSNWARKSPVTSPSPRFYHAMAYDSTHGQVVLFGGDSNETWIWDGSNWTQRSPHDAPARREDPAMSDFPPQGVLLFGGDGAGLLDDTWIWDGSNWVLQSPAARPQARCLHSMVYDSAHKQVILFGGLVPGPDKNFPDYPSEADDTWIWEGFNWILASPQNFPGARGGTGMAYDSARDQVVVFGGGGTPWPGGFTGSFNDTWIWSKSGATPPVIGAVITNSSFGGSSIVSPGSWVEIYGCGFGGAKYKAGAAADPFPAEPWRTWTRGDFSGNTAPISLDSVQVAIGGKPAFIEYISPYQINAQLPLDVFTGTLDLTVTNVNGTSPPIGVTVNSAPGLLAPRSWRTNRGQYVFATTTDGETYIIGPGVYVGNARPAKPGETIILYGIGFGSVEPSIDAGQISTHLNQLVEPFTILFGQTPAQVVYSGLAPGSVGLYQFNVVVPTVQDGDLIPLTFTFEGVEGAQTLYIAVHQ